MPIHVYKCPDEHMSEELFRNVGLVTPQITCRYCDQKADKQVSAPSHTPGRWGDQTGKYGVNGFFDKGLGATYATSMEKDRIMESKGLASAGDFDKHQAEDHMEKQRANEAQHDKNMGKYKSRIKKHGDKGRAIAETFSIKEMRKQGTLTDSGVRGD